MDNREMHIIQSVEENGIGLYLEESGQWRKFKIEFLEENVYGRHILNLNIKRHYYY